MVVKRSFQPQWFDRWLWIHYDESIDAAFCFSYVKAYCQKQLNNCSSLETTYKIFLRDIQTGRTQVSSSIIMKKVDVIRMLY